MKKSAFFSLALLLAVASILSCNSTTETPEVREEPKLAFNLDSAKLEIEATNKIFMDLVAKHDSVGVANLYSSDAKLLFSGMPPVVGRAAIQSVFGGLFKTGVTKVELVTKEVFGSEALLGEEEQVLIYVGDKLVAEDKALVLWKKENGSWKLFRDMTNSNK